MKALTTPAVDKNRIIDAVIRGVTIREAAQAVSVLYTTAVRAALDDYANETLSPSARAALLAVEISRLERLESAFMQHSIEHMDAAAGTLMAKLSQRRGALCRLDAPAAARLDVDVTIRDQHAENSTQRLARVLAELRSEKPAADSPAMHAVKLLRGNGADPPAGPDPKC